MTESAPRTTRGTFPKSRRLLRHADFERVYKKGRRHFATHMTVFYLRREADEQKAGNRLQLRVGFTVRKVLGGAVVRNRMKRRLREAVRLQDLTLEAPVDVVINPKASLLSAGFDDLKAEVARAFQVIQKSVSQEIAHRQTQ